MQDRAFVKLGSGEKGAMALSGCKGYVLVITYTVAILYDRQATLALTNKD